MRSSAILTITALAGYVLASPIYNNAIEKRVFVTDVTTEFLTVFVTEGQIPTQKVIQVSLSCYSDLVLAHGSK
jgi:formyltetrahydrofolate hydrolase